MHLDYSGRCRPGCGTPNSTFGSLCPDVAVGWYLLCLGRVMWLDYLIQHVSRRWWSHEHLIWESRSRVCLFISRRNSVRARRIRILYVWSVRPIIPGGTSRGWILRRCRCIRINSSSVNPGTSTVSSLEKTKTKIKDKNKNQFKRINFKNFFSWM